VRTCACFAVEGGGNLGELAEVLHGEHVRGVGVGGDGVQLGCVHALTHAHGEHLRGTRRSDTLW